MEDRTPNELRELVWRRLGHRDLCAASAVSRRWNDEIKRTPWAWRLDAAPLGRQPTTAPALLQVLLAACPELGQDLAWFEWRSLPIRVRLLDLRVSGFAFVQALRLSLSAATRPSHCGDNESDDNRATKDGGLPVAAKVIQTQFQALVSRMTDLPNPHPIARVSFRPAIMPALAEQLLVASETDAPMLQALCQSLLPLLTHQHQMNDMKSHFEKLQVREELVEAQDGRAPLAIRVRVVSVGSEQTEERWPTCFLGHWPQPLWPILLKLANEGKVDTQLVAGLISHWTVTLDWPSAAGATSRTARLTLNQYALLSVLSNAKGGGMTVSEVARALMIPAAYAWVVAESLAGLVAIASAGPGRLGTFYDSRSLLISNQELTDVAPGTELNLADREVRLRGKYLKLEITPAEEAALAEAQKLGAELLATLPAGPITTAPGLHVTGFALGFRCIHRCHCCYSCRVCERSVYELCPHCLNDRYKDKKRLAEACWMSRSAQYHLHCFARNRAEAIPPGKTLSAAQQKVLERLGREPLPKGGHLSAPAAAAIPGARPQVGHHAYTHLKEASLFSLETALAKGWQQLLRKERDSAAGADTVKAPQRD